MLYAEHAPASPQDAARAASPASIEPNIDIRHMADDQPIILKPRLPAKRYLAHRSASNVIRGTSLRPMRSRIHETRSLSNGECGNRTHRTDLARISRRLGHDSPSRMQRQRNVIQTARTISVLAEPVPLEAGSRINRGRANHRRASLSLLATRYSLLSRCHLAISCIFHSAFFILHSQISFQQKTPAGRRASGGLAIERFFALTHYHGGPLPGAPSTKLSTAAACAGASAHG